MLSNIVTAAKGLFSTQEIEEEDPNLNLTHPESTVLPERPKTMVSTRRTRYGAAETEDSSITRRPSVGSGKRKSPSASPSDTESQKKRKTASESGSDIAVVVKSTPDMQRNGTVNKDDASSDLDGPSVGSTTLNGYEDSKSPMTFPKSTHMRFESEEPIPASVDDTETTPQTKNPVVAQDESSDDDDAPETLDNSTQLANMKAARQNAEQAKQRHEQLKKEKRKERDQRLKSQAVSKKSMEVYGGGARSRAPEQDDITSESTATLQDSVFKDPRHLSAPLPALLPDEILNAKPAARLPTPVSENDKSKPRISQKRKFFDEEQKPPKDVRRGSTTIRVLDGNSGRQNALAPRVSKSGKHVQEKWLSGNRKGSTPNGLRRTTGGSKGFVRKG